MDASNPTPANEPIHPPNAGIRKGRGRESSFDADQLKFLEGHYADFAEQPQDPKNPQMHEWKENICNEFTQKFQASFSPDDDLYKIRQVTLFRLLYFFALLTTYFYRA